MATTQKQKNYLASAVGRRKASIARVYISNGTGKISINGRKLDAYFPIGTNRYVVNQPFNLLNVGDRYDIYVNVSGGGTTGQAGAIRLGVARVLEKLNASSRADLKKAGFLTRDSRKVERKKAGQLGARRRFQYSKR